MRGRTAAMPQSSSYVRPFSAAALGCILVLGVSLLISSAAPSAREFRLATFSVDVTIPLGHPCMGGGIAPAREIADPLFAKGFLLTGGDKPVVVVSFDWCEIRGASFEKW